MEESIEITISTELINRVAEVLDAEFEELPAQQVAVSLYALAVSIGDVIGLNFKDVFVEVDDGEQEVSAGD